ncbi:MAG: hypothetical protein JETCAE01_28760 [Anaerolineaceae bacterium]|nr:MAG: hypothetical protein JETCAE01_28760 [Anaerolineaceae bacterium]
MAFNPGEIVGPYRIIAQRGQGGMVSVFKAHYPAFDGRWTWGMKYAIHTANC